MHIEQLTLEKFQNYVDKHPLKNYCQTINYGMMMGQYDYDYEFIGLVENERVYAASLILTKRVGHKLYFAYSPKGFLIDYTDKPLFNKFIELLKEYYKKRNFVFIKINPEIAIGEVNQKSFNTEYNNNYQINQTLQENDFICTSTNEDFDETLFPTFTAIVSLKNFGIDSIKKNTRNKIRKGIRKGLHVELGNINDVKRIKKFMPKMYEFYYDDFYNAFSKNNLVDLFLLYIEPEEYLLNVQKSYTEESEINAELGKKLIDNHKNEHIINKKMNSDKTLLTYKNDIIEATKMLAQKERIYIGAAVTIKDGARVHIISSGYDKTYKHFAPNYYLYYAIMNHYKNEFSYIDLNGISKDFQKNSKYHGLNRFKLGFNPKVYELIGEHDLILSENNYKILFDDSFLSNILKKIK